ncbi:hypothetical protein GOBAR_AA37556 [Gossypium barbadense]|uniref:Protein SET DOMAIN GROUP 40-like n=1 Tax=Gossypium barbadense TaxID=3634 RepID=A0A2P5VWF3_GOSBA|nr:hypothetical protein GOBAR_AA37556 [Gossypium barbadense]
MKLCLLYSKPILLTLLPRYSLFVCYMKSIKERLLHGTLIFLHLPRSYSILAAFGELETQALQVDYAIWATQKAVTKAKYEWEQAFTLMKELKLKPPLLTFRAWIWANRTTADLKYLYGWLRHHPKYGTLAPPELANSLYYAYCKPLPLMLLWDSLLML